MLHWPAAFAAPAASQFLEREVKLGDHTYKYRVWLPHHYTKLHHWPVVLYLHGSGERGTDNLRQVSHRAGPALERYGERYKSIVVFPQADFGHEWYGETESMAMAELQAPIREFHGDPRRIYLTGISMGGAGAWYMARHNRKWAAIVPVCGEVARAPDDPFPSDPPPDVARIVGSPNPYATLAAQIGRTPSGRFTARRTTSCRSRNHVRWWPRCADRRQRPLHRYPNGAHDVWDAAYADAGMVHWMLQQKMR